MKAWLTILAICVATASPVWATRVNRSSGSGGVLMIYRPQNSVNPHEKAAYDALRDVTKAQDQVSRAFRDTLRAFESSTEWQTALDSARNARNKLELARREAMAKLQLTASYKSAQIEIWKMQQALDAARANAKPDVRKVSALAADLLGRRSALSKSESDVLAADESVREARYALIDAEAQLAALRRNFRESIQMNPQWREARSRLDDARSRLASVGD